MKQGRSKGYKASIGRACLGSLGLERGKRWGNKMHRRWFLISTQTPDPSLRSDTAGVRVGQPGSIRLTTASQSRTGHIQGRLLLAVFQNWSREALYPRNSHAGVNGKRPQRLYLDARCGGHREYWITRQMIQCTFS